MKFLDMNIMNSSLKTGVVCVGLFLFISIIEIYNCFSKVCWKLASEYAFKRSNPIPRDMLFKNFCIRTLISHFGELCR